jgi:hypothetical protein
MEFTEFSVRGVPQTVRCVKVNDRAVIAHGGVPRIAEIQDEEWIEGELIPSINDFVKVLKQDNSLKADIFTFSQRVTDRVPRFDFFYRWDSIAAIPIASYLNWWTKRISNHIRQDVNRAAKRGVVIRTASFTDAFVEGIVEIYNETPIRQGRPFWHYGKQADAVQRMNATFIEQSEFLGAYLGDELIGFLKVVYVDGVARLMQIISKESHQDKRPTNALIAKAVELCELRGCTHLVYGNYQYLQGPDRLTDFKRRNGFEELLVPRYYVPLSLRGKILLSLRLEQGIRAWVPQTVQQWVRQARASIHRRSSPRLTLAGKCGQRPTSL